MEEQEFVEKMKTKDENAFIYMVDVYKKKNSLLMLFLYL